jgi:hypothetical protein
MTPKTMSKSSQKLPFSMYVGRKTGAVAYIHVEPFILMLAAKGSRVGGREGPYAGHEGPRIDGGHKGAACMVAAKGPFA